MDFQTIQELINSVKSISQEDPLIKVPESGYKENIELRSNHYVFTVDLNRSGHRKPKCTFQLRGQHQKDYPLLRLDLIGRTHNNPKGDFPFADQNIPCPHLHIAHPDYGINIAYPLDSAYARMFLTDEDLKELGSALKEFLKRCNVDNTNKYNFVYQQSLFN